MNYEGVFCRLNFDESVFSYRANKRSSAAFFWNKFNRRVEVPVNTIIDMQIDQYVPFGRGLVFKIKSGYSYEKVKTLSPMNITAVPDNVIEELRKLVERNKQSELVASV